MKILKLIIISLVCFMTEAVGQDSQLNYENVIITRNNDDIIGYERIGSVSAETSKLYGKQSKLRKSTTVKIQKEALKIGADIVLIEVDEFAMTPINNVNMVGVAYKKTINTLSEKDSSENIVINVEEITWDKVIITRNNNDIKGRERIGSVSAETSKLYGKQSKLRKSTTIKIQKEAAKIGASIVLIEVDEFAMTPINNINMVGVAYK